MKVLFRIVAVLLFLVFFGFALQNKEDVVLRVFLGYEVKSPLVLLLLGFFVGGAVLGIFSMIPTVFRYRRELAKQKKALLAMQKESESQQAVRAQPPSPDGIVNQ